MIPAEQLKISLFAKKKTPFIPHLRHVKSFFLNSRFRSDASSVRFYGLLLLFITPRGGCGTRTAFQKERANKPVRQPSDHHR